MTVQNLLLCGILLACLPVAAQVPSSSFIEPAQASLAVGQSQTFQLLDREGQEIDAPGWSISDTDIVELQIDGVHAILTSKAKGHVVLRSGDGTEAEVEVVPEADLQGWPPTQARWTLRPIEGEFTSVLWATGAWGGSAPDADPAAETDPFYFYEDRGNSGSHLRAISKSGLQVWQWPSRGSAPTMHLICGDIYNGVLIRLGDGQSTTLVDLDSNGQERWRILAPGFSGREFAYNLSGALYFVQENHNTTAVHLVGVDAHTGGQIFSFRLPSSRERVRNLTIRDGRLICSPGAKTSTSVPIHYSKMMSDFDNVSHLIYSELTLTADAGRCSTGTILDPGKVHIDAVQKLAALQVDENLAVSTRTLEENRIQGEAATALIKSAAPTGDITFDEQQGVATFFAVRITTGHWRGDSSAKVENFQYRITNEPGVNYRFPVPGAGKKNIMMLGKEGLGFVTFGNTVTAFEAETGREVWRWESKNSDLMPYEVLADGGVVVHDGDRYTVLKDGKAQLQMGETYVRFVKMFRPPEYSF